MTNDSNSSLADTNEDIVKLKNKLVMYPAVVDFLNKTV
jgi:hypothetical protein